MSKNVMGMVILLAVIGATVYLATRDGGPQKSNTAGVVLNGLVGGEKSKLLSNPKVVEILADRYDITLKTTKAGSIDMVTSLPTMGQDFLWPSNNVAVDIFRNRGGRVLAQETIFNSPMVLYTWDQVTDALTRDGMLEQVDGTYYLKDFRGFVADLMAEKTWKELGLPQLYGKVAVYCTDPTRSNSGNMFAGLLANMLAEGDVADAAALEHGLPQLKAYFARLGHKENSSSDLFSSFLKTGVGAKPMIVGYENQLVEFSLANREYAELLRAQVRQIYPRPTVYSSHPVMALTEGGKRFIQAMKDKDIQRIAWEEHGFRSGLIGVQNDPSVLKVAGLPARVESVMPLPDAHVMSALLEGLQ